MKKHLARLLSALLVAAMLMTCAPTALMEELSASAAVEEVERPAESAKAAPAEDDSAAVNPPADAETAISADAPSDDGQKPTEVSIDAPASGEIDGEEDAPSEEAVDDGDAEGEAGDIPEDSETGDDVVEGEDDIPGEDDPIDEEETIDGEDIVIEGEEEIDGEDILPGEEDAIDGEDIPEEEELEGGEDDEILLADATVDALTTPHLGEITQTGAGAVQLVWYEVTTYDRTYDIYEKTSGGDVCVATVTGRLANLTGVSVGTHSYYIRPKQRIDGVMQYGEPSNALTITVVDGWKIPVVLSEVNQVAVGKVVLKWSGNGYATQYSVYESVDGTEVFKTYVNATTATLTNVPDGSHTYYIKPRNTVNGMGVTGTASNRITLNVRSGWMTEVTLKSAVQTGAGAVTLQWTSNGATDTYSVYELVNGEQVFKGYVTATSMILSNLPTGSHTYYVRPRTTIDGMGVTGFASNQITVEVVDSWKLAPGGLTAVQTSSTSVKLTWKGNGYATMYSVYEKVSGEEVFKTYVTGTEATLVNVPQGSHTYYIKPRNVVNGMGVTGQASASVTLSTAPDWRQEVTLTAVEQTGDTTVTVRWNGNGYATMYSVYEKVSGEEVFKTYVTGTSATLYNVPLGAHTYVVRPRRVVDGVGVTGFVSNAVTIDTNNWKRSVTLQSAAQTDNTTVALTWTSNGLASMYSVYEIVNGETVFKTWVTGTSATLYNVSSGTHVYVVKPRNVIDGVGVVGFASNQVTLTMDAWKTSVTITSAEQTGNAEVTVRWNSNGAATMYSVYEMVSGSEVFKTYVTGTSATLYNVSTGSHTYVVKPRRVIDGVGVTGFVSAPFTMAMEPWKTSVAIQSAEQTGDTTVVVKWSSNGTATMYSLYEIVSGSEVFKTYVTGTSATLYNVSSGSHTYIVKPRKVVDGVGVTGFASAAYTMSTTPWKTSVKLTNVVQSAGSEVTLSWNSNGVATMYSIYEMVNGSEVFKTYVTGTSATLYNVSSGSHTYVVKPRRVIDGVGVTGFVSNAVTITMEAWRNAVTLQTAVQSNNSEVTLTWTSNGNTNMYSVYELVGGSETFKTYVSATTVTLYNVSSGSHTYVVRPRNVISGVAVTGFVSNSLTVTMEPWKTSTSFISGSQTGNTQVTLSWKSNGYASMYSVYELVSGKEVFKDYVSGTTMTLYNVSSGAHQYIVKPRKVVDGVGVTGFASGAYTVNMEPWKTSVTMRSATQSGNTDVVLSWYGNGSATMYSVYELVNGSEVFKTYVTGTTATLYSVGAGSHTYVVRPRKVVDGVGVTGFVSNSITINVEETWKQPAKLNRVYETDAGTVVLEWTGNGTATQYSVYEIVSGSEVFKTYVTGTTATLYNVDTGYHTYIVKPRKEISGSGYVGTASNQVQAYIYGVVHPSNVTLNYSTYKLGVNEWVTLVATVSPSNATNKGVEWWTSNASVATVGPDGAVCGKGAGTCYIYATCKDGGLTVWCTLTVTAQVTGVTLNRTGTVLLAKGSTMTLTATVLPAGTSTGYSWTSNNSYATIYSGNNSSTATIRGSSAGLSTITVTTSNGKKASVDVFVVDTTNLNDSNFKAVQKVLANNAAAMDDDVIWTMIKGKLNQSNVYSGMVDTIVNSVRMAESEYRDLYVFSFGSYGIKGETKTGASGETISSSRYYSGSTNTLYLIPYGSTTNPYAYTFFHESGHAIDYNGASGYNYVTDNYESGALSALDTDIRNFLSARIGTAASQAGVSSYNSTKVINAVLDYRTLENESAVMAGLTSNEQAVYKKLVANCKSDINSALSSYKNSGCMVWDALEGRTNFTLSAGYGHYYLIQEDFNKYRYYFYSATGDPNVLKEPFAEYIAANIMHNSEKQSNSSKKSTLEIDKQYLPNLCNYFKTVVTNITTAFKNKLK